jgi:membrane associated rhomboid family serine protease
LQVPGKRGGVPIFNTTPMVSKIVLACALIHLIRFILPAAVDYQLIGRFAFVAARYTLTGAWQLDLPAFAMAPVTHMFLHGGFLHLFVNLAMLLAFGTAIERRLHGGAFTILYLVSGLAGAAFWGFMNPDSMDPLLGASGAISGMAGAVGRVSLGSSSHDSGMPFANRSTALTFVVFWLVFNFVFGVIELAEFGLEGEVAWEAHLGGFVAGFTLVGFLEPHKKPDTGLGGPGTHL